jgi:hypothetical protein
MTEGEVQGDGREGGVGEEEAGEVEGRYVMRAGRGGREWEKRAVWRGRQRRVRGWGGGGWCCSKWMMDEASH